MRELSSDKTSDIQAAADMESPLWLLQKEDTGFLYFSFLLSFLVHGILFAVMAASRIFHPFAGPSTEFDLLWFAPSPVSGTKQPVTDEGPPEIKTATTQTSRKWPLREKPVAKPSETPAKIRLTLNKENGSETEMVITRFGGKVIEIAESKANNPSFRTYSGVKMKSDYAKASVVTLPETVSYPPPPEILKTVSRRDTLKKTEGDSAKKEQDNAVISASAKPYPATESLTSLLMKFLQGRHSSSVAESLSGKVANSADHKAANEQPHLPAGVSPIAPETWKTAAPEGTNTETVSKGNTVLANQSAGIQDKKPLASERKPEPPAEKPSPTTTEKSQTIFHPPLAGDLKLIITGNREVKVEAIFREFRKTRRNKPLSKSEARNRRNIIPKVIRTRENVNEAVIETTEEGIYDLTVKSIDGKPVESSFVLKVHESGPDTKTRDLGKRSVAENTTIASVLMPEGILWDDDASFTGNMEDSESITKFQSETGLVWREYK